MRIIEHGEFYEVKKQMKCSRCGCIFEIDLINDTDSVASIRNGEELMFCTSCPECLNSISFKITCKKENEQ